LGVYGVLEGVCGYFPIHFCRVEELSCKSSGITELVPVQFAT
jgi:hypothetical protein